MKTYIMLIRHFRWTVGFDNQSVGQFNLIKVVSKGLSTLKYFRIMMNLFWLMQRNPKK